MRVAPPHELVLQGYLHKQSKHLRLWKVRFFMLSRRELLYAKKSGQKTRGALALADVEVVDDQNEIEHAGNFVLLLLAPGRRIFLSAATEKERDAWVAAIRTVQAEADGGVSGARHAHSALRSSSGLLSRPGSTDALSTSGNAMLQGKSLSFNGKQKARVSKERKEERRRRRLPKLKKPFSAVWLEDVIAFPRESSDSTTTASPMLSQVEALCFAGIPKEVRGRVWAWLLGNKLQINENLFKICKARAQAVQLEISLKRQTDRSFLTPPAPARTVSDMSTPVTTGTNTPASMTTPTAATEEVTLSPTSKLPKIESDGSDMPMLPLESRTESDEVDEEDITKTFTTAASSRQSSSTFASSSSTLLQDAVGIADMLVAHGERSINLVGVDMPRTFGHHPLFKPGAEGTARTTEVLEAYTCYRPDLGYVQGMSYLAATLCFHMDSFSAFKALVALLSSSLLFDMFRLESRTFHYFAIYNQVFEYELPVLYRHFQESGIDAQMYAVDWALTLFTRSLPLNLALRIWDCYVLLGTPFFFQASVGVLSLFEKELLAMQPEQIVRFLHNLPKTTSSRELFESIASVKLSCREIAQLLAGGELWSPDAARAVAVTFPDSYE